MRFVFAAVCSRRSAVSLVGLVILELWSAEQSMESVEMLKIRLFEHLCLRHSGDPVDKWSSIQAKCTQWRMPLTPLPLERWWLVCWWHVSLGSDHRDSKAAKSNGYWRTLTRPTFSACPAKWGEPAVPVFREPAVPALQLLRLLLKTSFMWSQSHPGSCCWSWPECSAVFYQYWVIPWSLIIVI